jgi:hypothetical protein
MLTTSNSMVRTAIKWAVVVKNLVGRVICARKAMVSRGWDFNWTPAAEAAARPSSTPPLLS